MRIRIAVLALGSGLVVAAQLTPFAVVGRIEEASSREIRIRAGAELLTFQVGSEAKVDLANLRSGSEVSIHGMKDASGRLTARSISSRSITVKGIVKAVDHATSTIEVATSSGPTTRPGSRKIRYYPNTVFSVDSSLLAVGQEISTVGFAQNGAIDATRVAIYGTDLPAGAPQQYRMMLEELQGRRRSR